MSISTATQFVAVLAKSRLLKPKHLDAVRTAAEKEPDPKVLAGRLVKKGLLSRWQARQLLGGHASFFLGEYRLIEPLSTHSGSHVYLAEHKTLGRRVVLKRLPRAVMDNPNRKKRLLGAVRAAVGLDHENVARVYSIEQAGDRYYVISQYAEGRDLAATVAEKGPLAFADVAAAVSQAASGLAEAHRRKAVHGGVRPSNLVAAPDGQVKLVSVATARRYEPAADTNGGEEAPDVLDAVHYQAPELLKPDATATPAADLYSLGCTLYFLLTGNPPFAEGTAAERAAGHVRHQPPGILRVRADAPDPLVKACRKMLAKRPEDRPGSADEVVELLAELCSPKRSATRIVATVSAKAPNGKTPTPATQKDSSDAADVDDAADVPAVVAGAKTSESEDSLPEPDPEDASQTEEDANGDADEPSTEAVDKDNNPRPAKTPERRPPVKAAPAAAKPAPRRTTASDEEDEYKLTVAEKPKRPAPSKNSEASLAIATGGADSPTAKAKSRAGKPTDAESETESAEAGAPQAGFARKNAKWLLIGGGSVAVLLLATAITLPFVLGGPSGGQNSPQVSQAEDPKPAGPRSTKPGPTIEEPSEKSDLSTGIDLDMDLGINDVPARRPSDPEPEDKPKPADGEETPAGKPAGEEGTATPDKPSEPPSDAGGSEKPKPDGTAEKPAETKPAEEKPPATAEPPKKEKPPTFRDLPAVVLLPVPPAAGQAAEPITVGKLHVRERAPWIAQLDGGDGVIPNAELALARDEGRAYVVRLTPRDQTASAIARFWFDDKASTLKFQWLDAASTTPGAAQLRLCQLRLSIDGESKSVAFAKPLPVPPLEFDLDKKIDKVVIDGDDLPDDKLLRFEITAIEGIDIKAYPFQVQPAGPIETKKQVELVFQRMDRDRNTKPIALVKVNFLAARKGLTITRRIEQPAKKMMSPGPQLSMARQKVDEEFAKTLAAIKKDQSHGARDKYRPQLDQLEMAMGQIDVLELVDKQVKIHYRILLQAGNHQVPLYDSKAEAPAAAPPAATPPAAAPPAAAPPAAEIP